MYHFLILLLSGLITVLSSPLGGWGLGSKFSVIEFKRQFSSFFFCDSRDKVTLRMEPWCDPPSNPRLASHSGSYRLGCQTVFLVKSFQQLPWIKFPYIEDFYSTGSCQLQTPLGMRWKVLTHLLIFFRAFALWGVLSSDPSFSCLDCLPASGICSVSAPVSSSWMTGPQAPSCWLVWEMAKNLTWESPRLWIGRCGCHLVWASRWPCPLWLYWLNWAPWKQK